MPDYIVNSDLFDSYFPMYPDCPDQPDEVCIQCVLFPDRALCLQSRRILTAEQIANMEAL